MTTAGEVYRQLRLWHGYLSAIAFLALIFFAGTGVVLNHPDLFRFAPPAVRETRLVLSPAERAELKTSPQPGPRLLAMLRGRVPLIGALKDADRSGDELFARLSGARGSSDLRASLSDGQVQATTLRAPLGAVLNELHRGEAAGRAWRWFIDITAAVLIALSVAGYAIFLSLRLRVRTALVLTALSLAAMVLLFALTVP